MNEEIILLSDEESDPLLLPQKARQPLIKSYSPIGNAAFKPMPFSSKNSHSTTFTHPYSNGNALNVLNRYRNCTPSSSNTALFPTIVSVESLAGRYPASSTSIKRPRSNSSEALNPNIKRKKPTVFQKQTFRGKVSSVDSIVESIESCIRRISYPETAVIDIDSSSSTEGSACPDTEPLQLSSDQRTCSKMVASMFKTNSKGPSTIDRGIEDRKQKDGVSKEAEQSRSINAEQSEATNKNAQKLYNVSENTLLFRKFLCVSSRFEEDIRDRQRASEKLQSYHERASETYLESKEFADFLNKQLELLSKETLYSCIRNVLDAFKLHKIVRRVALQEATASNASRSAFAPASEQPVPSDSFLLIDPSSSKDAKKVRKLQRALDILSRRIKKLEQTEVELEDEDDSCYLRMQRYRARFAKIYAELCKYTDIPRHASRASKKKIRFDGTRFPEANVLIARWLNKTGSFPDFTDVVQLFKSLNLGLSPTHLQAIAADAFQAIGEHLQKRRQRELWDVLAAEFDNDPAESDPSLSAKLEENKKQFRRQEQAIIDQFVEKQTSKKNETGGEGERNDADEDDDDDDKEADEEDEDTGDEDHQDPLEMAIAIVSESSSEAPSRYDQRDDAHSDVHHDEGINSDLLPPTKQLLGVGGVENYEPSCQFGKNEEVPSCGEMGLSMGAAVSVTARTTTHTTQKEVHYSKPPVIQLDYFTIENVVPKCMMKKKKNFKHVLKECGNIMNSNVNLANNEGIKRRLMKKLIGGAKQSLAMIKSCSKVSTEEPWSAQALQLTHRTRGHAAVPNGGSTPPDSTNSEPADHRNGSENVNADERQESGSDNGSTAGGAGGGRESGDDDKNNQNSWPNNEDDIDEENDEIEDEETEEVATSQTANVEDKNDRINEEPADKTSPKHEADFTNDPNITSGDGDDKNNSPGMHQVGDQDSNSVDKEGIIQQPKKENIGASESRESTSHSDGNSTHEETSSHKKNENITRVKKAGNSSRFKPKWIDNGEESESDTDDDLSSDQLESVKCDLLAKDIMVEKEDKVIVPRKLQDAPSGDAGISNRISADDSRSSHSNQSQIDQAKNFSHDSDEEESARKSSNESSDDEPLVSSARKAVQVKKADESSSDGDSAKKSSNEANENETIETPLCKPPKYPKKSLDSNDKESKELKMPSSLVGELPEKKQCVSGTTRKRKLSSSTDPPKKNKVETDDNDDIEVISENIVSRATPTPTPEERVNRFLANASKLAITITRKKGMSKETKEALTQLKKMKNLNVSASRASKPDLMIVQEKRGDGSGPSGLQASRPEKRGDGSGPSGLQASRPPSSRPRSISTPTSRGAFSHMSRPRNGLPIISSVQSWRPSAPMITGVRGGPAFRRGGRLPGPRTPNNSRIQQLTNVRPRGGNATAARARAGLRGGAAPRKIVPGSTPVRPTTGLPSRGRGQPRLKQSTSVPFVLLD